MALVVTGRIGRISPLLLTPVWLALAAAAAWPWAAVGLAFPVALLTLALVAIDGVGLALLPRLGRSFAPVSPSLLGLVLVHSALFLLAGWVWPGVAALLLAGGVNLAIAAVSLYATWIEPFRLGVTRARLRSPKLGGRLPLRLLHVTDLHVEHVTRRERDLVRLAGELAPDIVVLTGDYLNLSAVDDSSARSCAHDLLADLCAAARVPVLAVTGSPPVDRADVVPAIFEDLPITWLLDRVEDVSIKGYLLRFVGLRCTRERDLDVPRFRRVLDGGAPPDVFTLLLYHSPDLMPEAVEMGVDLYLCGHTHGGQIRLPFLGALVTSSDFWKRYEMGRYEEGGTILYVSRGVGMEGLGAPRARFLSPPEIVLWTFE